MDETVVKARKKCCVYSAVDVERKELILMRAYTTRNLTTKSFVKEVKYCENKPRPLIKLLGLSTRKS